MTIEGVCEAECGRPALAGGLCDTCWALVPDALQVRLLNASHAIHREMTNETLQEGREAWESVKLYLAVA